ncbi:MAG: hypothetical protein IPO91_23745 [Chloroflexi bacterium]|nr:hypothetical protein [Chloroflexota bacterium]
MNMQFFDEDHAPQARENVKIEQLEVVVYPDRFRVYIHIRVTPFLERPNLLLAARSEAGKIVSELSIIETMHHDMEFTMHLRGLQDPAGAYTLTADLFYETRNPPLHRVEQVFVVPSESEVEEE